MSVINEWGYIKKKFIGSGSYGKVYEVEKDGKIDVAKEIKMYQNDYHKYGYAPDILREIDILLRLNHPNILKGKYIYFEDNLFYIVFSKAKSDLSSYIINENYDKHKIISILFDVLCGLEYLHSNSIIHRDLKAENILLFNNYIKIADFGLSRRILPNQRLTGGLYTIDHRPPEIILGSDNYSFGGDMWAFGVIVYFLITGMKPFDKNTESEMLKEIIKELGPLPKKYEIMGDVDPTLYAGYVHIKKRSNPKLKNIFVDEARRLGFSKKETKQLISLLYECWNYDVKARSTATRSLENPLFRNLTCVKGKIPTTKKPFIRKSKRWFRRRNATILYMYDIYDEVRQSYKNGFDFGGFVLAVDLFDRVRRLDLGVRLELIALTCLMVAIKMTTSTHYLSYGELLDIAGMSKWGTVNTMNEIENELLESIHFKISQNNIFTECYQNYFSLKKGDRKMAKQHMMSIILDPDLFNKHEYRELCDIKI